MATANGKPRMANREWQTANGHEQEPRMDTKEHEEQDEPRMNADLRGYGGGT